MIKKFFCLTLLFIFTSCGSLNEAGKVLRNEKITTTDEFLVKKKDPLVFPPDFDKVPVPGSVKSKQMTEDQKIKSILNAPQKSEINKSRSDMEDSIIEKIRK